MQGVPLCQRRKILCAGLLGKQPCRPWFAGKAVRQSLLPFFHQQLLLCLVLRRIRIQQAGAVILRPQDIAAFLAVRPPALDVQQRSHVLLPGTGLAAGHPPGPFQICDAELSAGIWLLRRFKIKPVSVRGLQHHGTILFHASVHGDELSVIILSGQPQDIVRPQPPFAVSQAGGVAEAEHLAELRCSGLVEDEIRPPFFRRHRADLSTAIGGVVGLMPHGGPVAVVRRCRRQQRTAFSFTASGRRRGRARPAAAGVQTECQQQRRRQHKIFSAHSVIPMHPAP